MAFTVNLRDRGQQVVKFVDLLDEGQHGAGELEFRGRYETIEKLKGAINMEVLTGSPIEDPSKPPTNPLSFRRFDTKNKWGKRLPIHPLDPYPFKARWMLHMLLCFHFRDDWCYVDIGVKWAPFFDEEKSKLFPHINPKYPLGDHAFGDTFSMEDLTILRVSCGTINDAWDLVAGLGMTPPEPEEPPVIEPEPEIDGTVLSVTEDGEEYWLTDTDGSTYLLEGDAG